MTLGRLQSNLPGVREPIILPSAFRHGIEEPDILHAYRNAYRSVEDRGDHSLIMLTGAARNGVTILEIGVVIRDGQSFVMHAMRARDSYL
ncbi:hypothetical protein [Blastococcus saxobsidens]|uniref:Toxin n=1 Tax=Blastococcus saxobsidens (strain DD2) TaxID=1146883 RepID=H6RJU4_BLASD|nr:hypothetical protein [Blastococcus saxobsidens]CCG03597.1 conserved protein of unknown function [Blastococcus saxobsidens DD2]